MENNPDVTAVIPAYNEENCVGSVIHETVPYVDEILVIDDASTDRTARRAREKGATVIVRNHNRGPLDAIKLGFKKASGEIVVTLDADGEMPIEQIPKLVSPILQGTADMVQGRRGSVPRFSEKLLTWLASFGGDVGDSGTGFRALKTSLARELELNGICLCGIFSLEVLRRGATISEVNIQLRETEKDYSFAWFHVEQSYYVLAELIKSGELGLVGGNK